MGFTPIFLFLFLMPVACSWNPLQPDYCAEDGGHREGGCLSKGECVPGGAGSSDGCGSGSSKSGWYGYGPADVTPSPRTDPACWSAADCGEHETCGLDGVCATNDRTYCASDSECTPGAVCVGGVCGCVNDDPCEGFQCERYGEQVGTCVLCMGPDACGEPSCMPNGSCPGAMECDESTFTCRLPWSRVQCGTRNACPPGMTCGADRYCQQLPSGDAGRDVVSSDGGASDAADAGG